MHLFSKVSYGNGDEEEITSKNISVFSKVLGNLPTEFAKQHREITREFSVPRASWGENKALQKCNKN